MMRLVLLVTLVVLTACSPPGVVVISQHPTQVELALPTVFTSHQSVPTETVLSAAAESTATPASLAPVSAAEPTAKPAGLVPTLAAAIPAPVAVSVGAVPGGKIVFTCQMRGAERDQICIINTDGSGWLQLTDNSKHNWYASLSTDGQSVVYSSNASGNYEIYELSSSGGSPRQLTANLSGKLYAPEISPDGEKIVFTFDDNGQQSVWTMNRDGSAPQRVSPGDGWDPTWSPDGAKILFASNAAGGGVQLFTIDSNGSGLQQITNMRELVGRSDWSPTGELLGTYAGKYGSRSLYLMRPDGADLKKYTFNPTSAAPSFSPDGQWIVFVGYIDQPADFNNGCDIYIAKISDPSIVHNLTSNAYCDWQPRWGP